MLETIREYALEQLNARADAEELRRRHAEYYLQLVEMAEPELRGPDMRTWFRRLDAEHDNLRAALAWSQTTTAAQEIGLRLVAALGWFWYTRGYLSEGRSWTERVLAATNGLGSVAGARRLSGQQMPPGGSPKDAASSSTGDAQRKAWAKALCGAGLLAFRQNELSAARSLCEQSLALYRELGTLDAIAFVLSWLGMIAVEAADYATARAFAEESTVIARERVDGWNLSQALFVRGVVAHAEREHARAKELLVESLALAREQRNTWLQSAALNRLGHMSVSAGDYALAHRLFVESLHIRQELDLKVGIVMTLEGMAGLAAAQGLAVRAARLFAAAEALRESIGAPMSAAERGRIRYAHQIVEVRAQLGEAAWAAAWAEGQVLSVEQAIAYAATDMSEPAGLEAPLSAPTIPATQLARAYPAGLTEREVEILRLVSQGLTYAEIAAALIISRHTVNAHLRTIYGKLGVTSRSAATRFAVEQHLV